MNLGSGELGGLTLVPGLNKWGTGVLISTDVTLDGGPEDTWIFQISGGITEASNVNVTLSGGAPTVQSAFAEALLARCRERGLRTAVATAGFTTNGTLDLLASKTYLLLFDLKLMDDVRHREFTGVSNVLILNNLERLAAAGPEIWVRIPLVRGVNDDDDNIRRTIAFLASLKTVRRIGLLPYHSGGLDKAGRIGKGMSFRKFEPPSEERLAAIEAAFREAGFEVRRGG